MVNNTEKHTRPVYVVNGFQYNPKSRTRDNPEKYTFPLWRDMLDRPEAIGHGWFSVPLRARNVLRAWMHGRWNRYRYAWDLAEKESKKIDLPVGCDVLCHSLGTYVVLGALAERELYPRNVLLLNGAAYSDLGLAVAHNRPATHFWNFVVPSDDVLNVLARFAPGFGGRFLGNAGVPDAPKNWTDIYLDNPLVKGWGRTEGFDLAGDNPKHIGDHWYSFENRGNWGLYRAILEGKDLSDLPR